jgi:hypothetical protein
MPRKKKQPEILKVENNPDLIRDTANSAIINTNEDAFAARRAQIQAAKEKQTIDEKQQQDILQLQGDVAEIKQMLQKLIGGK